MSYKWKNYYLLFLWLVIIHRQKLLKSIYNTNIFKGRAPLFFNTKDKSPFNFPYTVLSFEFTILVAWNKHITFTWNVFKGCQNLIKFTAQFFAIAPIYISFLKPKL